jgi:DNA-binding MarR family transcriptional regulator
MKTPAASIKSQLSTGELGFMITGVRNAIWSSIERELQPLDITAAQFVVFNTIAKGRGSTIGDLCRVLGYDSGAMTRLLDRIEKKGLIRRVANPDDRRSYLIELTEQSAALVPKARRQVQAVFGELLQGFDEREAVALKASLEKILENAARVT